MRLQFILSSSIRHPSFSAVPGVHTCALPIYLKIELVSPNYFAQHKNLVSKTEGPSIATGEEIVSNLQEFVRQRPDISGDIERQLPSSIREEEKSKKPKFVYNGIVEGMSRTTAGVAKMAVQQQQNKGLPSDPLKRAADIASAPIRKVMNLLNQQPVPGFQPMVQPKTIIPTNTPPAPPAPSSVTAAPILNPLGFLRPGMATSVNISGGLLTIDKYKAEDESSLMPEEQ